jgi:hypothetical protein
MGIRRQTTLVKNPLLMSAADRRWLSETPAIELWDAWVFAEVESDLALESWYRAPTDDKPSAYAAYVAALDREERAAASLAERLELEPVRSLEHAFAGP